MRFLNKQKLIDKCVKLHGTMTRKEIGKLLGIHKNTVLKYQKYGGVKTDRSKSPNPKCKLM